MIRAVNAAGRRERYFSVHIGERQFLASFQSLIQGPQHCGCAFTSCGAALHGNQISALRQADSQALFEPDKIAAMSACELRQQRIALELERHVLACDVIRGMFGVALVQCAHSSTRSTWRTTSPTRLLGSTFEILT